MDYVEESINNVNRIDRLNLVVKFSRLNRQEGDANIERWLNYAINNNVKELFLSYHTNPRFRNGWRYVLPDSLYRSTSLETLDLFGCQFKQPRSDSGIRFSLKKLGLSRVFIDQETLQTVVSSCDFLEQLCIESCQGFEVVRVAGHKLEVVDLYLDRDKVQIVAVSAPNLRLLSYGGGFEGV
ncbi:hypothetical protein C2S53_015324 [Perilla frutescens var. hirtella]|uniref:F-box/LRR-repeat protein 15/At3g58940/PEG3-like LRR domain-containing protein n=1 Tax=Perilla frutescens var. hirtella TaxID=608512 RepID=A0AAD4P8C9_PERFH|nr:hypothetical protein C2S53_015324 [Perilla frutescens var. hirtella]